MSEFGTEEELLSTQHSELAELFSEYVMAYHEEDLVEALLDNDTGGHFPITIDTLDLLDKHDDLASAILANPVR